jgi:hypothetical protein
MRVVLASGALAEFVELHQGDHVVLDSSAAAAPGTPLVVTVADGTAYSVKVRTCRKVTKGPLPYRIEGRLFNVTRAMRTTLAASLSGASSPSGDSES